jgi:hypothetical protein
MADRVDFYFRQRVTEAELDLACELLEQADRDLAADVGIYGIVTGAVATQHRPVPDLTVDLTSPTRAYDRLGQRIFVGTDQTVNCSVDLVGIPTVVSGPANERWLAIFLRFERQRSDPRTDGNAQQVYFRREESFEVIVRQAPEGPVGSAVRVALQQDELLVCDIRLTHGQTQILDAHIDPVRRQAFIFADGASLAIDASGWQVLRPAASTVQSTLDDADAVLARHFGGAAPRHGAEAIDIRPRGFLTGNNVQDYLDQLVELLTSTADGVPGAARIGADAVIGTPHALGPASVDAQLAQLLGFLNAHLTASANAHSTSAIASPAQSGTPYGLAAGTARSQLVALLANLNAHASSADHDARYYRSGAKVADADLLDGLDQSAFARATHDHDARYLRQLFLNSQIYSAGQSRDLTSLASRPAFVHVQYAYLSSDDTPQSTFYSSGALSESIRHWVTKVTVGGASDFRLTVQNTSTTRLYLTVAAYGTG